MGVPIRTERAREGSIPIYYFRFARLILARGGLQGAGYVLFLSPAWMLHNMDHPAYSAFPLFAFLPLVTLNTFYRTGSWRHYLLADSLRIGTLTFSTSSAISRARLS